jgi:hypothetical protein
MYRNLTIEEIKEFHLYYHNNSVIEPVYEGYSEVWSTAIDKDTPYYRIYNCGTNNIKVLFYNYKTDSWDEIKFEEIQNIYGLVYRLLCKIGEG